MYWIAKLYERVKTIFLDNSLNGYAKWIRENEPSLEELKKQKKLQSNMQIQAKISIIVPVYNPDVKVFRSMLNSVAVQTYENWELCIADASTNQKTAKELYKINKYFKDKVKIKYLNKNYGISGNSNHALSLATGDYCLFLDHDDSLAPFALYELVSTLNKVPNAGFIYSDRDIITCNEKRMAPFFKPHWSPDLLLSQNYLCHVAMIHRDIVDSLGGFRSEYDGAQDYDYFLRATELSGNVIHIPKVLYHWRIVEGSSSIDSDAKPYAYEAAIQALNTAIKRRGWHGQPSHSFNKGYYKINFSFSDAKIGVIFDATLFNASIDNLIQAIRKKYKCQIASITSSKNKHGSSFKSRRWFNCFCIRSETDIRKCLNDAVDWLDANIILFLRLRGSLPYDLYISRSTLGLAERNITGVVVPKLIARNKILSTGLALTNQGPLRLHENWPKDSIGYNGLAKCLLNVSACEDICFLFKKELFKKLGGFDFNFEEFFAADFCLKLFELGYVTVFDPSFLVTIPEESYNNMISPEISKKYSIFIKQWDSLLEDGDLYYNPNFDQRNGGFNLSLV